MNTPIETYKLNGVNVDVKRDDLVGDGINYPRWSKIGGIRKILESNGKKDDDICDFIDGSTGSWVRHLENNVSECL